VSEPGLTNQWEPWQRLIDSIGPYYRRQLLAARDRAKGELCELEEEQLAALGAEGRRVASSLDEEGTRLTVSSTEDRERHSRLATELEREAELLRRRWRLPPAPRRRRKERADAAERADRAQEHRRRAAQAHEQLRELGNSGRHLYPWFERHQHALGRGLAAELTLNAAQGAVYHVLGAPGIASLTAACLTCDRAIDLGQLQELVRNGGEARQRLPQPSCTVASRASPSVSCWQNSTARISTACLVRSPWSSGAGARSRGRRMICGSAPRNPRVTTAGRHLDNTTRAEFGRSDRVEGWFLSGRPRGRAPSRRWRGSSRRLV